jgi:hypothetical protein
MRPIRLRFTIRGLMLVVAAVALLLVASAAWILLPALLLIPVVAFLGSRWLIPGSHRLAAAIGFWSAGLFLNAVLIRSCSPPRYMVYPAIALLGLSLGFPTVASLGFAWATITTSSADGPRRRSRWCAWACVAILAGLPLLTVLTLWPFRLAFLVSRPELNRLADDVAAGRTIAWPQRVGPFLVVAGRVEARNGNIGLLIDPNPSGPAGFVRMRSRREGAGPFSASGMGVDLDGNWEFREED